jgi:hypothetical protein
MAGVRAGREAARAVAAGCAAADAELHAAVGEIDDHGGEGGGAGAGAGWKEATVRGFSAVSLMLIDEAARVSDDMYRAAHPMLAVGDGDLWMISTPFGKRGFFWDEWTREGGWERVAVPATQCPRIPASFLAEEKASLGDLWHRQEYLCEFVERKDCLFSREMVERAATDEVKPLFR